MKIRIVAVCALVLAAAIGIVRSVNSWNGAIYVSNAKYIEKERNPAAIRRTFDYSLLEGEPLKLRSLRRLVNDAKVVAENERIGIELGHFVTKGEDGRGQFACDYYGRVQLTFEGEGIMEFGEKPVMHVEAPCVIGADINRIETIWIPFARLMTDNKSPARFIETTYPEAQGVSFTFDHMTSEWPREWSLVSVKLFSDTTPSHHVTVGKDEMGDISEKPVVITF